jgi:gliding motility-associated-like protein
MFNCKPNKWYNGMLMPHGKLLLFIILFFVLGEVKANAMIIQTSTVTIRDTTPQKRSYSTVPPINLNIFPIKTTCDPDFFAAASGGDSEYIYTSSDPSVATIDKHTGYIHIISPGTTFITVVDPSYTPPPQVRQLLTVNGPVTPTVTISELTSFTCAEQAAIFTATPNAGEINPTYVWVVNNSYIGQGNNSAVFKPNNLQTGDVVVCQMTDNSDSCVTNGVRTITSNAITVTVLPYSKPGVTITQSPEGSIPSGVPIIFTATPTLTPPYTFTPYTYNYQWQLNGNDIPNANSATYTSTCSHNYDYFNCVVTPQGPPCLIPKSVVSADQQVTITGADVPVTVSITASANDVYAGTIINFRAVLSSNARAVAYQWQINGVDTSDVTSELSTFSLKNNDVVTCVIFTDNGCKQVVISNPVKMVIYPAPNISIPNTFTPNGDGINDVWDIKYLYLYHYASVKIYNRYGSLLFQSKGYDEPWDGRYKGQVVPTGTYYYVINMGIHTPYLSGPLMVIK